MAGRSKNATPKFFPWVILEFPYTEIWGEETRNGSKVWICRANPTNSVSQIGSLIHKDAKYTMGAFEAIVLEPGTVVSEIHVVAYAAGILWQ